MPRKYSHPVLVIAVMRNYLHSSNSFNPQTTKNKCSAAAIVAETVTGIVAEAHHASGIIMIMIF